MDSVSIDYTNYKGQRALRLVMPQHIFWGATSYHREPQWMLIAIDVIRGVSREFAMRDIHAWGQAKVVGVTPTALTPSEQERVRQKYGDNAKDLLEEIRSCFTRDDDLPNGLLSRIDSCLEGS